MYQKLNQNSHLKRLLVLVIVVMLSGLVSLFPYSDLQAQNALGLPFGGRVTVPVITGYVWYNGLTPMYCPPHIMVANFGPAYLIGQPFAVFVPPAMPKQWYNYYTPGVGIKGAYYPVPNLILCPFYPVYYSSLYGTGLVP
jgi:hypothetical protein